MKQPTIQQFKKWAIANAGLGMTVVCAQAFAKTERQRVDAYIAPIFASFTFHVSDDFKRAEDGDVRITDISRLYLTDLDSENYKAFVEACADAHAANGWTGEREYCPALVAEQLQREAERALLKSGSDLLGVDLTSTYGDQRTQALDLLLGATVKAAQAA